MRPPDAETDFAAADPRDDHALLRQYVDARDEGAFTELVRRRVNLVYGAARRQLNGDPHRAEEATQAVFTVLARKAASVARHPSLAGWLYTTTHYAVSDVLRQERRRRARETEAHMRQEIEGAGDAAAEWDRLRPVLDTVLRELNERDREAILARFFEGRAFAELGRRFASSEDAARMRVERALEKLRVLLARRGVTSTAAALGVMLTAEAATAAPAGLAASVAGTALTSTAALGPVATAIQFMITSKTAAGVVGTVVLAAALGTAVHETHARNTSARTLSAATADAGRMEARLRETRDRANAAEQARDEARDAVATAEAAKPAPAPAVTSNQDPLAAGRALLAEHPEAKALWDERERLNLEAKLAPVFQAMNLGLAEREQMETIMVRTMSGTTTFNGPDGPIALRREQSLTQAQAQEQMLALLGPDRLADFVRMSKLAPTFDLTVKLASAVYRTEPLTPEQATRMMQIFANQAPGAKSGSPGLDWNAVEEQAGAVLSPQQQAGLVAVRRNFEFQQAFAQAARAAVGAAPTPNR